RALDVGSRQGRGARRRGTRTREQVFLRQNGRGVRRHLPQRMERSGGRRLRASARDREKLTQHMPKLRVAIVAPTLDILGGHSVQAQRLLAAWRDDPDISAWLVPINPLPTPALRPALRIKYVRTLVTEATYIPQLVRQLARADVVHIFSASYSSFLLAPLPAMLVAEALGRPVVLNYHSGHAADHLEHSRIARTMLAGVACNV